MKENYDHPLYKHCEEKDADETEKQITEINAGIYCFDIEELLSAIKLIKPDNA